DHPERLEREQRLVLARLLAYQQVERPVGRLKLVALVLELLEVLDKTRRGRVVELDAAVGGAFLHRCAAGQLGDEQLATVAGSRRVDVLERARVARDAGNVP